MNANNPGDFARIKRVVPLQAVLARYGVLEELKRSGTQLRGCCPIHRGTNARQFVVNVNAHEWHCFGDCGSGGSTLEFVAAMERVDVYAAAKLVAQWFAIGAGARHSAIRTATPEARRRAMSGKPSHKVYTVRETGEGDEKKSWWTRLGSAWPHADGRGLNIVLDGVPVNGRLSLREFDEDVEAKEQEKQQKKPGKK